MKLYEFAPTRSIRARWILQELGVDFEAVNVNLPAREHHNPHFLELNPAGKVPAADRGFIPADPEARAELYRWTLFAVTELEQPLWRIARHTSLYPERYRLPADIALARRDFLSIVGVLENHMKGRAYVVGDHVTACDFVVAYTLDWAGEVQLLDECPTLRAYVERMYARPRAPRRIGEIFRAMPSSAAA